MQLLPDELKGFSGNERTLLNAVWFNQGIRTHEITDQFLPSNNLHTYSNEMKVRLYRAGWEFHKEPVAKINNRGSWAWYLVKAKPEEA